MLLQNSHPYKLIASDRVQGIPVHQDGRKLGIIRRLMIDKATGQIEYVVVATQTFFGVDFAYCAVPWNDLIFNQVRGAYDLNKSSIRTTSNDLDCDWGIRRQPRFWFWNGP